MSLHKAHMSNNMETSPEEFDSNFYDADYFERGQESGKSWLQNYRWMPRRTFREAFGFIDYLGLDNDSYVLEVGCAKGFLVKALRELHIKTDGCDISDYALSFAPEGCWKCTDWSLKYDSGYTHIIIKDMLEHLTHRQLRQLLQDLKGISSTLMCVVPMGDNGKYRIPEYHMDVSHLIAEDETWWSNFFEDCGWRVVKSTNHVLGIKDNWQSHADGRGNHSFVISCGESR